MSKKQGWCDNCGGWSDKLTSVFWESIGSFENYCESCSKERA